jgi:hypothetical protein
MESQEMQDHFDTDGTASGGFVSSPEGQCEFSGAVDDNNLKFDLKVVKPMKIALK